MLFSLVRYGHLSARDSFCSHIYVRTEAGGMHFDRCIPLFLFPPVLGQDVDLLSPISLYLLFYQ